MQDFDWQAAYSAFDEALEANSHDRAEAAQKKVRRELQNRKLDKVDWLIDALTGEGKEHARKREFIASAVSRGDQLPDWLLEPLICSAVRFSDPSTCRYFIEPALRAFGTLNTLETLVNFVENDSDQERASAVRCVYWVPPMKVHEDERDAEIDALYERAKAAARKASEEIHTAELREAVANSALLKGRT